jgi:hypothetical protein
MKRLLLTAFTTVPVAGIALALFACNTAAVNVPEQIDSGNGLCVLDAAVAYCDAAGVTQGCAPAPDSGILAISGLGPGTYPVGCETQTNAINNQLGNTNLGNCYIATECYCQADGGWACTTQ